MVCKKISCNIKRQIPHCKTGAQKCISRSGLEKETNVKAQYHQTKDNKAEPQP